MSCPVGGAASQHLPQARLSLNTQLACSIDVLVAVSHSWPLLTIASRVARKHTYLARDSGNKCCVAGTHQLVIVRHCRNLFCTVCISSERQGLNSQSLSSSLYNVPCMLTFSKLAFAICCGSISGSSSKNILFLFFFGSLAPSPLYVWGGAAGFSFGCWGGLEVWLAWPHGEMR